MKLLEGTRTKNNLPLIRYWSKTACYLLVNKLQPRKSPLSCNVVSRLSIVDWFHRGLHHYSVNMLTILQLAGNHMESKCWKASGSYVNFLLKKYAKEIVSSATEIWALQIRYLILNRAHISKNNYVVLPGFSSNWATYRACVQYGYIWSSANKDMFVGMQKERLAVSSHLDCTRGGIIYTDKYFHSLPILVCIQPS